jgi:hypothetical protein
MAQAKARTWPWLAYVFQLRSKVEPAQDPFSSCLHFFHIFGHDTKKETPQKV